MQKKAGENWAILRHNDAMFLQRACHSLGPFRDYLTSAQCTSVMSKPIFMKSRVDKEPEATSFYKNSTVFCLIMSLPNILDSTNSGLNLLQFVD